MDLKKHVNFERLDIAFEALNDKALGKRHFIFSTFKYPWFVKLGSTLTQWVLQIGLPVQGLIKSTIFDVFCGGVSLEDCLKASHQLSEFGVGTIFDYSVEGEKTEKGFEATTEEVLRTIRQASKMDKIRFAAFKITGLAAFDLLEKIHAGQELTAQEEAAYTRVEQRVERICSLAAELGVSLLVDAEETWIQKPIDDLTIAMMSKYNKDKVLIYYTFQMYCHAMLVHLKDLHQEAQNEGYKLGAKLVRGAYMEKERARAHENGYEDPIQPNKESTDRDFNAAAQYCVDRINDIGLFAGSHNEETNYLITLYMEERGLSKDDDRIYMGQLYGMSDHISFNLAKEGYNVIKYVPYGPLKATIPYLIRRADENTSVAGQSGRELTLITQELTRRSKERKKG
jgi:proline dehydrogenase